MRSNTRPYPADLRLLTALRAFAALLVVLFHFSARTAPGSVLHTTLIERGQLGVDVFFVLSGFILAHVYFGQIVSGRFRHDNFLVARFARLYPMHLLMTAVAVAMGFWGLYRGGAAMGATSHLLGNDAATGGGSAWNFLITLGLVQAWGTTNGHYFNAVSWSISAEAFAYVLFPAIAALALKFGSRAWLRLTVALAFYACCEAASHVALGSGISDLSWHFGILRILPEFILGVAFYGLGAQTSLPRRVLMIVAPCVLAAVNLMLILGAPVAVMPPLFGLCILMLANAERDRLLPPDWLFRPLVYLGEISYSTYMLHLLLGQIYFNVMARLFHFDPHDLPVWQVFAAVAVMIAASALTFQFVERPGRDLLRNSSRRTVPRPLPLAAAI